MKSEEGSISLEPNGAVEGLEPDVAKTKIKRRTFLKILGSGAAVTAAACTDDATQKIYPNVHGEVDQIPGVATWFSSTCTECSAGCGLQVRVREGRAVKVEGNSSHPINRGGLCALGQSSVQNLYDPDRIREPLVRVSKQYEKPVFKAISWDEAYSMVGEILGNEKISKAFITSNTSGSLEALTAGFCEAFGAERVVFDPLQAIDEARASEMVFGVSGIPRYRISKADLLVNFGADFLETWISPVEFAREWADSRRGPNPVRVMHFESRLSLTAASADSYFQIAPGSESLIALALLKMLLDSGWGAEVPSDLQANLRKSTSGLKVSELAQSAGISFDKLSALGERIKEAKSPLFLAGGSGSSGENGFSTLILANILNLVSGAVNKTVQFDTVRPARSSITQTQALVKKMQDQKVGALFISGTNPAFTLPQELGFVYASRVVSNVISFGSHLDETAQLATLILPVHTGLESWGDTEPRSGVYNLLQPAMTPVFNTRDLGDILLDLADAQQNPKAKALRPSAAVPKNFQGYVKERWKEIHQKSGTTATFEQFWRESLERGGFWSEEGSSKAGFVPKVDGKIVSYVSVAAERVEKRSGGSISGASEGRVSGASEGRVSGASEGLKLLLFPSVKSFDGRAANRPWLQEIPDPMSQIVWDSWVELHPTTAAQLGIEKGDLVTVRNRLGELNVPAHVTPHIFPGVAAVPLGQGHEAYGRYAQSVKGGNAFSMIPAAKGDSRESYSRERLTTTGIAVEIKRAPGKSGVVFTQGSDSQHNREIARTKFLDEKPLAGDHGGHHGKHGEVKQMYNQREHPLYRWAMAVDLSACTGCSACIVACYAENNIPVAGKEQCNKGREMAWLRIERYLDGTAEELAVSFLPMMCQHCGNAPCEPVCPVYATYHNEEGLNAMVYNRCVGTRYCSNNCSYKVRRFNWFEYDLPEPLNWQLNPDVTKRTMGVMEKCTFCVQRINEGKDRAKDQGRLVQDGEIQPACVQSCPTQALTFGNLNDPNSSVSKLSKNEKAYKVLDDHLNTQPAVSYLERIRYRSI